MSTSTSSGSQYSSPPCPLRPLGPGLRLTSLARPLGASQTLILTRMGVDFPFAEHLSFHADDDDLHAPGPDRDWTETTWWSFNVPERALGGWLYVQIRPNLGTSAG